MTTEVTHSIDRTGSAAVDRDSRLPEEPLAQVEPRRWGISQVRYPAKEAAASVEMLLAIRLMPMSHQGRLRPARK